MIYQNKIETKIKIHRKQERAQEEEMRPRMVVTEDATMTTE